jgi:hypothetical protein
VFSSKDPPPYYTVIRDTFQGKNCTDKINKIFVRVDGDARFETPGCQNFAFVEDK